MSAALVTPMSSGCLTPSDLANLERSWIDSELAEQARIRRVDTIEGASIVGRSASGNFAGLTFPYITPGQGFVHSSRLRRDQPEMELHKGQPRERNKYMSATGAGNRLYFVPGTPAESLTRPDLPIILTEGEKKCLALWRLANHRSVAARFLPIGLAGVWSWRGVNGKTVGPKGDRRDTKGPIGDLSRIDFEGRTVHILFDANTESNASVAIARSQLALELGSRGARVHLVDLPPSDGVNGIDDFLGRFGPEAALGLIESARAFDPKEPLSKLDSTDYGNERAFEILFGEEFRYDWTGHRWLRWNGVYWEPDSLNFIDRRMLQVAAERLDAAALLPEKDPAGDPVRKKAGIAALKLRNVRVRQSAIDSATSNERFACRAEDFDKDDFLFACANGVYDLRQGVFRAGRRDDMLTRATRVTYDPVARCDRFLKFLGEVFQQNSEMLEFIQRAVGLSLTGLTREEVFFILYGKGRNGKGVLLRVLLELLGDYAVNTDFQTLIADKTTNKGPRNDLASMANRRFVSAQESRDGAQFDESLIKALTGGDVITARFLHKEFFTFKPTWKIWIATNHRPEIRGSDDGIWSRPKLVPFDVSFEGREDRGLKAALLEPVELSGVLNWAIEGCRRYLEDGLHYPQAVTEATAAYKSDSDFIGRFLEECCVIGQGCTQANALYQSFVQWVNETGEQRMSEVAFAARMKERGIAKKRLTAGMSYQDIGLRLGAKNPGWET
jgi:P4 family phage/plasmid primase-like protien